MFVLPVIAIFLWIFVVGLVRDWRTDGSDDTPARWLSMATLLPWVKQRAAAALAADDPYPDDDPAPPAAEPALAPAAGPALTAVPALATSQAAAPVLAASAVAAGHDPVDIRAVAS